MDEEFNEYRPRYHFTPQRNWMNDPNGLVYKDGVYHLYYQHNPYATHWGHMSWGHATSPDLLHWQHLPIAIWEEPALGYTIFSGSAVVDKENTAGFGKGAIVAIYTADYAQPEKRQDIHIAWSTDNGSTFKQYAMNPVFTTGEAKFGDPKVFWHAGDEKWIMVNICGRPQGHVDFYSSPDLRKWSYMSSFYAESDAPGIWECPDLFNLPVDGNPGNLKWVLKVNCTMTSEAPAATRYFMGDFDGHTFIDAQLTGQGLTSDHGAIYAEVTYNDEPQDRRVLMGWLRETPHEDRPWTGAMAIPRELSLQTFDGQPVLCQEPVVEMRSLRYDTLHIDATVLENAYLLEVSLQQQALEVQMNMKVKYTQRAGCTLSLSAGSEAIIGYDAVLHQLFFICGNQRITVPFHPPRIESEPDRENVQLRLFLDRSQIEIFGNRQSALTSNLPFGADYESLRVFSDHGPVVLDSLDAWVLTSK
jgi:fructan beta-fructosidase